MKYHTKRLLFVVSLAASLMLVMWASFAPMVTREVRADGVDPALRFVDEKGGTIANAQIRLLCFETSLGAPLLADITFAVGGDGEPLTDIPSDCNYAAAMHLRHTQLSGKPGHEAAYWVYTTSWEPGSSTLQSTSRPVVISTTRPLVLFNVIASLAWEPPGGNGSAYVKRLHAGLAEASGYLYDITDGRMAFGPVTIHTDGRSWQGADIRVLPANDFRPSAQIGGIVPEKVIYEPPGSPIGAKTSYTPGAILLGRNWIVDYPESAATGEAKLYGASDLPATGNWNEKGGYRTIVHEWLHYALFLYDEYQTPEGFKTHCTGVGNREISGDDTNASVMDWHYTSSELWYTGRPGDCASTKQYRFHGLTDCETLEQWYAIQDLPNAPPLPPLAGDCGAANAGPNSLGLTGYLFGRSPFRTYLPLAPFRTYLPLVAGSGHASARVTGDVQIDVNATALGDPCTQVYVRQDSVEPPNLLYQGQVNSNSLGMSVTVLGAQLQPLNDDDYDTVHIFGEQYAINAAPDVGRRWYGEEDIGLNRPVDFSPGTWSATLDTEHKTNDASQLISMTVVLSVPQPLASPPHAWLCNPAAAVRCSWEKEMQSTPSSSSPEVWKATFEPLGGESELPRFGIVHVDAGDASHPERSLARWYRLSGVGPATHNAHPPSPPSEDDFLTLYSSTPIEHCNQVVTMPAANHDALIAGLGAEYRYPVEGILSCPLDIAVRLPDGNVCPESFGLGAQDVPQDDVILTLFYNHPAPTADPSGDFETIESRLRVLHFTDSDGWMVLEPTATDVGMNWLAAPFRQDGIYAIGWLAETPTPPICSGLPTPYLSVKSVETGAATTYRLTVDNRSGLPDELFEPAPHLSPCGTKANASRTWVDVLDQDGRPLNRFCAFTSAEYLDMIWFSVTPSQMPPTSVYIRLQDRECGISYTSNAIAIPSPVSKQ